MFCGQETMIEQSLKKEKFHIKRIARYNAKKTTTLPISILEGQIYNLPACLVQDGKFTQDTCWWRNSEITQNL